MVDPEIRLAHLQEMLQVKSLDNDEAALLELALENEQRKDENKLLRAEVAALKSAHQTLVDQYQRESAARNKTIIEERGTSTRRLNQLIVVARAVCPVLRQFLLMKGAMPTSSLLPCGTEVETNAKEMLVVLQQFETM